MLFYEEISHMHPIFHSRTPRTSRRWKRDLALKLGGGVLCPKKGDTAYKIIKSFNFLLILLVQLNKIWTGK